MPASVWVQAPSYTNLGCLVGCLRYLQSCCRPWLPSSLVFATLSSALKPARPALGSACAPGPPIAACSSRAFPQYQAATKKGINRKAERPKGRKAERPKGWCHVGFLSKMLTNECLCIHIISSQKHASREAACRDHLANS